MDHDENSHHRADTANRDVEGCSGDEIDDGDSGIEKDIEEGERAVHWSSGERRAESRNIRAKIPPPRQRPLMNGSPV